MSAHFAVIRGERPGPVVVEVPHAGLVIDDLAAPFVEIPPKAREEGALIEDSDLGADLVWAGTETAGVTRVVAHASRYVIDLNTNPRPPPQPPFYEDASEPRSFIRRSQCGRQWIQKPIPREERERRISEILEPYHSAIDAELERARAHHGSACLVASHTFPDRKGTLADVVLGTRRGDSANVAVRDAVADVARSLGFTVALEDPFSGGWSLTRHGRPGDGVHAIQIEIARRLVTGGDTKVGASVDPDAMTRLRALAQALIPALTGALAAAR